MVFRFGDLELDDAGRALRSPGGDVPLQPRVFDLLVHLLRHRDRVVSKEELVEAVWAGAFVTDGAVQRAVSMLRSALRAGGAEAAVRTFPRQGYRFCTEVEETESAVAAGEPAAEAVAAARRAFDREDWAAALDGFRQADVGAGLAGDDLERWGQAAEFLGRLMDAVVPLERAVAAFSASGAACAAARAALRLANVQLERREAAVAGGWLRRAARYLGGAGPCHETALLEWLRARFALFSGELEETLARAEAAHELACRLGDRDVEALGLLYRGIALTALGEVRRGVDLLDEAAATVLGEGLGRWTAGIVYCGVIWSSLNRGDWRRAAQWCDQFTRWCATDGLCGFPGLCRLHHSELLALRGRLREAQEEAEAAIRQLAVSVPFAEGDARRVLGEIRLARGDLEGAEEAFRRAHELGWDPNPGLARLRLAQGRPGTALRALEGALEVPDWALQQRRGFLLAYLVSAALAAGEPERARRAAAELAANPELWETEAAAAAAARARGELALAGGEPGAAASHFRRAVEGWREVGAPAHMAAARAELAVALEAMGDREGAELERQAAAAALRDLGLTGPPGDAAPVSSTS